MKFFQFGSNNNDASYQGSNNNSASPFDEMSAEFKTSCKSLSYENRLYGFFGCFVIGFVISLCSSIMLYTLRLKEFAIMYSFGSLLSIFATMFLVGPIRQIKVMFHKYRWAATSVYLVLIGLTLFVGLRTKKIPLVLVLAIMQFLAGLWYALSYVPYARKVATKLINKITDC